MKSMAQQSRPARERSAPAARAVAPPKVRPGAGNRRRQSNDSFERQAEDIAARAARGERSLARHITPTVAADFRIPSSRGVVLAPAVLAEMEQIFGADLAPIRVHTDAAATAAARTESAFAFASGKDIYFDAGRFAPGTTAGKRLLAHEVAHVLQQTGRAGSKRMQVAQTCGSGPVQHERKLPLKTTDPIPDFDTICQRHKDADQEGDQLLRHAIADMKKQRASAVAKNDENAFWTKFEEDAKKAKVGGKTGRKTVSLLFDLLKSAGKFDGASALIKQDILIRSCFYSAEFVQAFPEEIDVLTGVTAQAKFFKDFPLRRFIESFADFLFGPSRDIPDLGTQKSFTDEAKALLKSIEAPAGLIENDLVLATIWAVKQADDFRQKLLVRLSAEAAPGVKPSKMTPLERTSVARKLMTWVQKVRDNDSEITTLGDDAANILRAILPAVEATAKNVVEFWEAVAQLEFAAQQDNEKALKALRGYTGRPEFKHFRNNLLKQARALFKLPTYEDGKIQLPSANEFAAQRDAFANQLLVDSQKDFEFKLLTLLRTSDPKADVVLGYAYGWMLFRAHWLIKVLSDYTPKTDSAALDFQIHHRLDVARNLIGWTRALPEWTDISDLAMSVIEARQEGQEQSFLSLMTDWEPDASAPVSELTSDFGANKQIHRWEPLTFGDLVSFFETEYNKKFAQEIEQRLQSEENQYDISQEALLIRAQTEAKKLEMPKRYIVREYDMAIQPTDNLEDLIAHHPKTEHFLAQKNPEYWLIPDIGHTVFLWTIPDFLGLVKKLQAIDEYSLLVYRKMTGDEAQENPDLSVVEAMDPAKWWDIFKTLDVAKTSIPSAHAELAQVLATEHKFQHERLEADQMRASILDRSTRTTQLYRQLLELYGRYSQYEQKTVKTPQGDRQILGYEIPDRVLGDLSKVVHKTAPVRYQPFHEVAYLLELADLLKEKLSVAPRTDVVIQYLPVLDDSLAIAKKEPQMLQDVLTPAERNDPKWLSSRMENLSDLAETLHKITLAEQERFGITGMQTPEGGVLEAVGHSAFAIHAKEIFKIGNPFGAGGAVTWRLIKVLNNFTFHPQFGPTKSKTVLLDSNGDPVRELTDADKSLPLVEVETGDRDAEGKPIKKIETHTITGGDPLNVLPELSFAVTMESIRRDLAQTAELIQGAMEMTMEAAELLPIGGQVLMAGRLVVSITQFLVSPEFKVLREEFFRDPGKILREGLDVMKGLFEPITLWEYLLFASNPFDRLRDVDREPTGQLSKLSGAKTGLGARIKSLLLALYHFGKRMLGYTGRFQTHIRWKAEHVQYWVLERPLLAAFLHFIANHIDEIVAITTQAVDFAMKAEEAKAEIEDHLEHWPEQMIMIVDHLQKFELPKEIIPMWQVYAIITDLVISRLGLKFRVAGKAIMFLLQKTGKDKIVFEALNQAIKQNVSEDLDLNRIWQYEVETKIDPLLKKARTTMAVEAFDAFAKIPFLSDKTRAKFTTAKSDAAKGTEDTKTRFVEEPEEQPQTQPYLLGSPSGSLSLPREAGAPMTATTRRAAERRFGHDFSHVRVHTGPATATATARVNAAALTSGSHVYLGARIPPGSEIFDHELTHVLQQTGPRPLGHKHDPTPRTGNSHRGIRYDSEAESAAHRTATRVRGKRARRPIDPGPTSGAGAQPSFLVEITRRFLEEVSQTGGVEKTEERTDRPHLHQTPENVRQQVAEVWSTFQEGLKRLTARSGPFRDSAKGMPGEIGKYLTSKSKDDGAIGAGIEKAIDELAGDSMREVKSGKKEAQPVTYRLDIERFRVVFERYILGKSGIALKIEFAKQKNDNDPAKVTSVAVDYVYLQVVHGASNLWQRAVDKILPDKIERAKWLPRIRTHLAGKGPTPGIWDANEYSLKASVLEDVKKELAGASLIEAKDLPNPLEYCAPRGNAKGALGQIGLRLGTYSEKKKGGNQNGTERESHHITQYLLLEYFANKTDPKAFKLLKAGSNPYPGLTAASGSAQIFSASGSSLYLQDYEQGRGGKMPAILLARTTHRTGGLHVTTTADDFDDNVDSPAKAVDAIFAEKLTAAEGNKPLLAGSVHYIEAEKDSVSFQKYKTSVGEGDVRTTIYQAMQGTYKWMKNYMQPRLKDALERVETKYYNDLAQQVSGPELHTGEVAEVWMAAVAHNKEHMGKGGWRD